MLPLTPREKDILICVSEGKSNREIAGQLTIATSTVKWYVRQIYSKLGVDNRVAAIDRAQSLGLLPTGEAVGKIRHNLPAATTPFVGRDVEWLDGANFGRYMARIRWEC